jgi:hypothetical protein
MRSLTAKTQGLRRCARSPRGRLAGVARTIVDQARLDTRFDAKRFISKRLQSSIIYS